MNEMLDAMEMNCCIVCCANLCYCCIKPEMNKALLVRCHPAGTWSGQKCPFSYIINLTIFYIENKII